MKKALLIAFTLSCINVYSQEVSLDVMKTETSRTIKKDADTLAWNWKHGGMISLNLSQGSLSNWAAGGDNFSLAMSSYFNYFTYYKNGHHTWDNNFDFNFGYIQTTSLGARKNDDRIDFLSKYGYQVQKGKWYLSGLFDFRTQMFDGYTYPRTDSSVFSSTFLSPAYIVLSGGFDYKPNEHFSMFLSPATARWVVVANKYLYMKGLYGVDSGKHSILQFGAFSTLNYSNTFSKNIMYKSRLDLFSNYSNHPEDINLYMTNQLSLKIAKYFTVSYSLDLIYDNSVKLFGPNGDSPALQVKSLLGVGYLYPLNVRRKVAHSIMM